MALPPVVHDYGPTISRCLRADGGRYFGPFDAVREATPAEAVYFGNDWVQVDADDQAIVGVPHGSLIPMWTRYLPIDQQLAFDTRVTEGGEVRVTEGGELRVTE